MNDGTGPHTWNYTFGTTTIGPTSNQMIATDPLGNDTVHTNTGLGGTCSQYETEMDQYAGSHSGGTLMRKTVTSYNYNSGSYGAGLGSVAINVVPATVTTTDMLAGTSGKTSEVAKTYDAGLAPDAGPANILLGDILTETESDFGNGSSPGGVLRTTTTAYMALSGSNASHYLGNNLLDLPYTVQVSGTSGQAAYTTYGYDESALQSSGVTEQKVTGVRYPGNQTSVHRWLNGSTTGTANCSAVTSGYLVTNNAFYDTGEVQQTTDPCSDSTTFSYANQATVLCSNAYYYGGYLTSVANALGQTTNYCYDLNMGSVTLVQDPNLQQTTKTYDEMNRLIGVSYPDGGLTTYCYTDGVPSIARLAMPVTLPLPSSKQRRLHPRLTKSRLRQSTAWGGCHKLNSTLTRAERPTRLQPMTRWAGSPRYTTRPDALQSLRTATTRRLGE